MVTFLEEHTQVLLSIIIFALLLSTLWYFMPQYTDLMIRIVEESVR